MQTILFNFIKITHRQALKGQIFTTYTEKYRNIRSALHTCNIVYIIKTMNIGIQQKIKQHNIQYTQLDVPPILWNIYTKLLVVSTKNADKKQHKLNNKRLVLAPNGVHPNDEPHRRPTNKANCSAKYH